MILGIGIDVVHVPDFSEQMREGSVFARVFTAREHREAARRAASHTGPGIVPDTGPHLAVRWAAKESFIKAWSQALHGCPPVINEHEVDWNDIEIMGDAWHRPRIYLHGIVAEKVAESLGDVRVHVSLSHDGPCAFATVLIEKS